MRLTDAEQRFLTRHPRGHLSTIGPDGSPQVKPLGFTYNTALGTIDIAGFNMGRSAKYRNIGSNPRVAFVVDEVTADTMEGAHFLEIRGVAEAVAATVPPNSHLAFNIDPEHPGLQTRDLATPGGGPAAA